MLDTKSFWEDTVIFPEFATLTDDINVDVVIIGGGITGLLNAYKISEKGMKVALIESNKICNGVTKNTTAKITSQHRIIYDKLVKEFGLELAAQYAQANQKAIEEYDSIIQKYSINCDFVRQKAYAYATKDDEINKIEKEIIAAKKLGIDAYDTNHTSLPFDIKTSIVFSNQAQFHPLKFLKDIVNQLIINGVQIYEGTRALSIENDTVITDYSKIKAKHIVVCTHFPFINTPGYYFVRLYQSRSYVIAIENNQEFDGMYIDINEKGYSFRTQMSNNTQLLLIGGEGHKTGRIDTENRYGRLEKYIRELYSGSKTEYRWSTQDCISLDEIPYIGKYSNSLENVYVATGFNKWGMSSSMVSAMIISDMINGIDNPYQDIFSPNRFDVTSSIVNLASTVKDSAVNLIKGQFIIPDRELIEVKNGEGKIIEYKGEKVGIYKDTGGNFYGVRTECPHLGCQLKWNQDELSWDCPCHGSRFDYEGKLINNPAQKGLERVEISR